MTVLHASAEEEQFTEPLAEALYDSERLHERLLQILATWRFNKHDRGEMSRATQYLVETLDGCTGTTLQERWRHFERRVWPEWLAGRRELKANRWAGGVRLATLGRVVRPSWEVLRYPFFPNWLARLPADDPVAMAGKELREALEAVYWTTPAMRNVAFRAGLRLLLVRGYTSFEEVTEEDLCHIPSNANVGTDVLDLALCGAGMLDRSPQRATSRHARQGQLSPHQLVEQAEIPEPFQAVTTLYLEGHLARIGSTYGTLRSKINSLAHWWRFVAETYPEVRQCRDVLPYHGRAFIDHALDLAQKLQRSNAGVTDGKTNAYSWLVNVRTFFADLCTWAAEEGSQYEPYAPRTVPLTRHDLVGVGFEQARRRTEARLTATVLDLEREMPGIRAYALRRWQDASAAESASAEDSPTAGAEADAFWDWALVELLVQSGLRIEEARELTTLDVLKRQLPDGRLYYLLHVKPSKYDRARVIPIGDGLGRVIAEIIRHVKRFAGTEAVPYCELWDHHEKCLLPAAPYLLQSVGHPSVIGVSTIRDRLRSLSVAAGAQTADGSPLALRPHDCRRVFASEHLNNNTPVHVIQALLGHETLDTVMVYAKLYPNQLVEEYRQTVRGRYGEFYGDEGLRNPTAEEWEELNANSSLRDMGTHMCALPTGEYCPKGLVCLGCSHAQPKKSAAPVFAKMLSSHERELEAAGKRGEPAGQIAAREMEVSRIRSALNRAEELSEDVAAAIEGAAE